MAIRVLATIPDLTADLPIRPDVPAAVVPAAMVARAPSPAPRRSRTSFPGISIAALTLVAAAIWSVVAIREATRTGPDPRGPRIAAEPTDRGATETTRR